MHTTRTRSLFATFVFTTLGLCAPSSYADALLAWPDDLEVMAIDGISQKKSLLRRSNQNTMLATGEHQLTVRYKQLFELRTGDHEFVRSEPLYIKVTMQNTPLSLQWVPESPKTLDQAKVFRKAPQLRVFNTTTSTAEAITPLASPTVVADPDTKAVQQFKTLWDAASTDEKRFIEQYIQNSNK